MAFNLFSDGIVDAPLSTERFIILFIKCVENRGPLTCLNEIALRNLLVECSDNQSMWSIVIIDNNIWLRRCWLNYVTDGGW